MNTTTQSAATRALNGASIPAGVPRPLPTRARRPGLIAGAVLLIVGLALTGGLLVSGAAGKTEVLVAAGAVPAGHVLTAGDVRATSVAGDVRAIRAADLATVVGQSAAVGLVPGQLLNRDMLTTATVPAPGQAMIGLSLAPGQFPADGLAVGDQVLAVMIPAAGGSSADASLTARALTTAEVFGLRSDPSSSGATLVTLVVPLNMANQVLAQSAVGRIGLVKVTSAAPTAIPAPARTAAS
ncbi:SAF domain-containing protein [Sporichthya sp.]|uniref:SAF domain-containing protein n=1 Tax=Sporichthya sp. TaxID=65475 RepID=UPI001828F937|nr:SAF domain-containing protein [Sporichthya sp.]MBA3745286.1 SAF domain-containing protein [Sporichthya sp.]